MNGAAGREPRAYGGPAAGDKAGSAPLPVCYHGAELGVMWKEGELERK